MGQKEKLIKKLKSRPKDFTFDEAETLLHVHPPNFNGASDNSGLSEVNGDRLQLSF